MVDTFSDGVECGWQVAKQNTPLVVTTTIEPGRSELDPFHFFTRFDTEASVSESG